MNALGPLVQALAALPESAEILARDGVVRFANPAYERMTGRTAAETIGREAALLSAPGLSDFCREILAGVVDREQVWVGDLVVERGGSAVREHQTWSPIAHPDGPMALVLRCPLRATEDDADPGSAAALYRHFFEHNVAIKLLLDPETGRIEDANEPAAAFYGYPRNVLCGKSIHEINTLPASEVRREMELAAREQRRFFRFPHKLASGAVRTVEISSGPVVVRGKTRLLSIVHDVTERERALAEVSASREQLRELLDLLPVGVSVEQGGAYVYANDALERMLGYGPGELLRTPPDPGLGEASDPGSFTRGRMPTKEGAPVDVELRTAPFTFGGAPAKLTVIADTSERDRLEEELRRAQRLESLGRLAGGVAHDFNNLLFVIVNAARYVEKHLPAFDPLRVHAERIQEASDRAAAVTRQLLLFSRGGDVGTDPVDTDRVVTDTMRLLAASLGENTQVVTTLAGGPVRLTRTSLEQVLVNLAVNARDAMPEGGTLRISTAVETLDLSDARRLGLAGPGRWVRIQVADTGPGIPAEIATQVFEPFFTTKDPGRGTGLGLSITYGIVQRAGGRMTLESHPGMGAVFSIFLRCAEASATEAAPRSAARPTRHGVGETILLVEDDAAVRDIVATLLAEAGYRVLGAPGPGDALLIAEQHPGPIDLVLSDVMMPRMSGPEMVGRLLQLRPNIQVLFMSGYPGDALARVHLPPGAELLGKPFTEVLLLDRVRAKLDRR